MRDKLFLVFLIMTISFLANAQNTGDLVLEDPEDMKLLLEEFPLEEEQPVESKNEFEQVDELDALKEDIGSLEFTLPEDSFNETVSEKEEVESSQEEKKQVSAPEIKPTEEESSLVFDVGVEEKKLYEMAKKMRGKIPENEWNEIASATTVGSYTVVKDDWLWKISKRIFGSGFYYSKIWALNPYITNPHLIEPGMVLSFTTGSQDMAPQIQVGSFDESAMLTSSKDIFTDSEFSRWGDYAKPDWIDRKKALVEQGVYFQYATGETDEDLKEAAKQAQLKEYENYEPPRLPFNLEVPDDEYDSTGFDKATKMTYDFKQGFSINTFVSSNVVQDFGYIASAIDDKLLLNDTDRVFIKFDNDIDIVPGDKFSIYSSMGEVTHPNSDREGFKYIIKGAIETLQRHDDLWECVISETTGEILRDDRVTVYTPKIESITRTFSEKVIEAAISGAYVGLKKNFSFGDVIYIDRGRADGVELGNVFEVYGFTDRGTGKNITTNPTYKNAEGVVITLTDNFATVLVTNSQRDFFLGDIAVTKSKAAAARDSKAALKNKANEAARIKSEALEELDVELNLEDVNESLLDKADRIKFTEDELAELERQEREKSIMSDNEKDLRALERLEQEIETSEKMLNEARLDEDKMLENQSLDDIESKFLYQQQESIEEIEENFGKRYLDEDLNDKDNPYGLTEFDIEEIDELLNVDQKVNDPQQEEKTNSAKEENLLEDEF